MKAKWIVRLGQHEWARHTRAEDAGDALCLLGSVQRGAQIGALAVDHEGAYFQVNGEYISPLNKRLIGKAVSAAKGRAPARSTPAPQRSTSAPVVTVRRRRVAVDSIRNT
ncbi:hypothetical protein BURC_04549 [Burkholderiaceae bacterium]|nr:hypothetical protein BURC_04549 [Burkholderiaceae bacterium]